MGIRKMSTCYRYRDGKLSFYNVIANRWTEGKVPDAETLYRLTTKRTHVQRGETICNYFLLLKEFVALNRWLLDEDEELVYPSYNPKSDIEVIGKLEGLTYVNE